MKRIILAYNEYFNKNSRKNKKNKIENLFYKLEELNNIKAQLINEKQIRLKKIEFELADVIQDIAIIEKELNIAISNLDNNDSTDNSTKDGLSFNIEKK